MRIHLFTLLLLFMIGVHPTTVGQDPGPVPDHPRHSAEDAADNENTEKMQKAMEKKENEDRHAQLKRDTDKLLQLTTELKQYVDKTNSNVLSIDVIKKAEEIEKLAHSVKEKMKG